MTVETISEPQFLLTELRYTLGQLHVQVLDLDAETRAGAPREGRSIDMILDEMLADEDSYQRKYSSLLDAPVPETGADDVPLPVSDTESSDTREARFEHKRAQTIALLERAGNTWSPQVLELVKEQVQKDRQQTTAIAECRKSYFEADQRPDLNQPITTHPEPHVESS
jgi:hypothetical protein